MESGDENEVAKNNVVDRLEFAVNGKLVMIQRGAPVVSSVNLDKLTRFGALLKTEIILKTGTKMGLIVTGLTQEDFELLKYSEKPSSSSNVLRTQAEVTSVAASDAEANVYFVQVRFIGNIHFTDTAEV